MSTTWLYHLNVSVNGHLVYMLLPSEKYESPVLDMLDLAPGLVPNTLDTTWIIPKADMRDIESHLHQLVNDNDDAQSKIPLFGSVRDGVFLYMVCIPFKTHLVSRD